ncbi:hypothetical protein R1flu_018094 [Riccia fluitans]|uniref:Uncharacterized protein n=1 Tax=Riccia fluitans TaxID=41844 RepID=A0ABD1ZET8_9MARC
MSRFNGSAAMELVQQHSGGSMSSISYGSQGALGGFVDLDGANSVQSPSSGGLGNLNSSLASNVTADFGGTFLESSSQNSLNRALGSATVIPFSHAQTQSQVPAGSLTVADEWSGTSNGVSGTSNMTSQPQPQQQVVQNSSPHAPGYNPAKQSVVPTQQHQQQMAFDENSRLQNTKAQGVQNMLENQPTSTTEENGSDLTYSHNGAVGSFLSSAGFQSGNQPLNMAGATENPMLENSKSHNQETGFLGGQVQDLQNGLPLQQQNHPTVDTLSYHGSSFSGAPVRLEEPDVLKGVLDNLHRGNAHMGLQGHLDGASNSLLQSQDSGDFSSKFHGGQASGQQLSYRGQVLSPRSSLQVGQHGMFHGPSSNVQSHRNLGVQAQGSLYQAQLQNLSPQSNLQSLSPHANNTQLGYHRLVGTATHLSALSGLSNAHAVLQGQAGGSPLNPYQSQVHGANQQLSLSQQSLLQARQGHASNQQQLFQSVPSYQPGRQQTFQIHPGVSGSRLQTQRSAEQMFAQMQPRIQNQILQTLKAGGRPPFQAGSSPVGPSTRELSDGSARSPVNIASACSHKLTQLVQEQRKRPPDNNISFWRNLVSTFFEAGAKKRWCLTSYNSQPVVRHAPGLFPADSFYCNLCQGQPGRGFESTMDILPRLLKMQYDSGLVDELLFLDSAEERCVYSASGIMVLEYPKAVHESVFSDLRVVRHGRLRVSFSSSFKIRTWEFCTQNHDEVVPRKAFIEQASQLSSLLSEFDAEVFDKSVENLTKQCNEFTTTAKQLVEKLDAPITNDLGMPKRYARCVQIAEVVNSMKDLMDYNWKHKCGPIASLNTFPNKSKLRMEAVITGLPTFSQVIDHITQSSPRQQSSSFNGPQQMFSSAQNQISAAVSGTSSVSRLWDPSASKLSSPTVRSNVDSRSMFSQMQPPNSLFNALGNSQVHHTNMGGNSLGTSTFHYQPGSSHIAQLQGQLASSPSGHGHPSSSSGISHAQLYQQILAKQQMSQQPNQILSQSQSLNQTGQHSLPGTPQSEMSDTCS